MILTAEYVSNGHPDRLCDAIVNNIVNYCVLKDKDALCGLECAVHTNKVFVDGRIAGGRKRKIIDENKIEEIIRNVYKEAGYGKAEEYYWKHDWHPYPEELEIILDVCIETLSDDERDLRQYSDDQNIVNGYALNLPETNYFPIAHYLALTIGETFTKSLGSLCGPDFKILVQIKKENNNYEWERLTLSVQQYKDETFQNLFLFTKREIDKILNNQFQKTQFHVLSMIDEKHFYLNGAGDFIQGGPIGDNGLSGKKLCIDFYGPTIPIGGGAIYGKDPHKVDVCGAFKARELALYLVKQYNYYSVYTTLAWSPGETSPHIIEAYSIDEFGTKVEINKESLPPVDSFSIECINNDLKLNERNVQKIKDIK